MVYGWMMSWVMTLLGDDKSISHHWSRPRALWRYLYKLRWGWLVHVMCIYWTVFTDWVLMEGSGLWSVQSPGIGSSNSKLSREHPTPDYLPGTPHYYCVTVTTECRQTSDDRILINSLAGSSYQPCLTCFLHWLCIGVAALCQLPLLLTP